MEVPTVLSPTRIALRIAEQIVDTPVPRGRDRRRLQGSLPRQSSTAAGVQNVDIPVRGGLRGFLPGQSSALLVDSSSGGLQDFHLGQGSTASSSGREDDAFSGVFRTFPWPKKSAKVRARSRSELAAHSSSSTPGAHGVVSSLEEAVQEEEEHQDAQEEEEDNEEPVLESAEWVQFRNPTGKTYYWNRRTHSTSWNPPPGTKVV